MSPTSSIPPTATAIPTISPIPTPRPDSDGDGYGDELERRLGTDPTNPNSRPLIGDLNGDGQLTLADAVFYYRIVQGIIPNPGVELPDFDGDGIPATEADARFLYRWILYQPGATVLELD